MPRRPRVIALVLAVPALLVGVAGWRVYRGAAQRRLDVRLIDALWSHDMTRAEAAIRQGANPNMRVLARRPSPWQRTLDALLGRAPRGSRPLLDACMDNLDWSSVEVLVRHGANPDLRTRIGSTPLLAAVMWGPVSTVHALLDHGADPHARSVRGESPAYAAVDAYPEGTAQPKLALLLAHGADATDPRALQQAVLHGHILVAGTLLRHGADPNLSAGAQLHISCLGLAALNRDAAMVRLLLRYGADPTAPATPSPISPETPSVIAAEGPLARLLRRAEADWRRRHAGPAAKRRHDLPSPSSAGPPSRLPRSSARMPG